MRHFWAAVCVAVVWSGRAVSAEPQVGRALSPAAGLANPIVVFSPDSRLLAVYPKVGDAPATIWDLASGKSVATGNRHAELAGFSADSKTFVQRVIARGIAVLDIAQDKSVMIEPASGNPVPMSITPDGTAEIVRIVPTLPPSANPAGLAVRPLKRAFDHTSAQPPIPLAGSAAAGKFSLSDDGKTIAGTGEKTTILVWEVASGRRLAEIATSMHGEFHLSPNGKILSASQKVKDPSAGPGPLATIEQERTKLFDAATGKEIAVLDVDKKQTPRSRSSWFVHVIQFSPDGKTIVGYMDQEQQESPALGLWNASNGRKIGDLEGPAFTVGVAPTPNGLAAAHNSHSYVHLLVFSGDGQKLTGYCRDEKVRVWDARTAKAAATFPLPAEMKPTQQNVVVSFDGQSVASGQADGTLRVWKLASGGQGEVRTIGRPWEELKAGSRTQPAARPTLPESKAKPLPPGDLESNGTQVFIRDPSGKKTPLPDGDYQMQGGYILHIRGGRKTSFP